MGSKDNYIGPWAPKENLHWQGNVLPSKKKYSVNKLKKMIASSKLTVSDLITIAWDSARTIEELTKEAVLMEHEFDWNL